MLPSISRRLFTGMAGATIATAAEAASFGNPDRPAEGAVNATPQALSDPGPNTPALAQQLPSLFSPPPTDIGDMPPFWNSFNIAHRRIQDGGWARQVTQSAFPVATEISGVNMRLAAGGIRELHWHLAAEWAYMTKGRCRVTVLDAKGQAYVQDVGVGDLWYFPAGAPHSLQGLGPEGCEFLIAFDNGEQSEYNTLLLSDWIAHTPPEVLAANFGVPAETFRDIPLDDLWIFQGQEPGPLSADQAAVRSGGVPIEPFTFSLAGMRPLKETRSGALRMADSTIFKASKTVAAALETIKPGGLRTMHWHPNADEWQYYIQGKGRMTVFRAGPRAQTSDFQAGDVGYVTRGSGHYIQNTGDTDLILLAVFRTAEYQEVSLTDWLARTPPAMVAQTLRIDPAFLTRLARGDAGVMPA